ncbi:MAG: apurinic endonuclease [Harvfovirus sp.]|uniref:Apurinic endonuclease n=1 Tax=Harvfovirus sp. TaxID=2487768 RepID=A0A3G5A389_9VIRU|nr:MAG: apurinic endonuclease [Harvfovirus sp.]
MYVGAHGSGNKASAQIIKDHGGNLIQIFVNSLRTSYSEYLELKKFLEDNQMKCVVHASYTINLSRDWDQYSGWIQQFIMEISLAHQVGAIAIVVHMGKQMELELAEAYNNMYTALLYVHDQTIKYSSLKILLETPTGQGSEICYKIEDMAYFFKKFSRNKNPNISNRFGLCVDTCHVFAAGYNLVTKAAIYAYLEAFEELIGLRHLYLIHLNDSKQEVGSNVDRHENIGKGKIGKLGLTEIVKYFKNLKIPIILETPAERILEDLLFIVDL